MIRRDYQTRCSDAVIAAFQEYDSALVVMPTGTGKTILFADVIRRCFPFRAIVVAHRQELIFQARDRIREATGMRVEVEMGEHKAQLGNALFGRSHVVVSSIQTLTAGGDGGGRMGKFEPMDYRLLIIDEAHHAVSPSYQRFTNYCRSNPKLKVLGVTATPDRTDEEALGQIFDTVAFDYEIIDAIKDGWLVPIDQQIVSVGDLDFSNVRTTAGDLNGADLAAVMEQEKPLHGVAWPSIEIIGDKRTLVFASSVKHAELLCQIFNRHRAGMASWVCGQTDKTVRQQINTDFNAGKIQVLCNCGTHTEGFDSPGVEVVIMARPTKSRALYAQMVGRSTRPLPGVVDGPETAETRKQAIAASAKPSCLIVDFVGNSGRHKLVTTADILGGQISDEAIDAATSFAKKSGKPVRMAQTLEDEEERQKQAEKRRLEDEARKARLVAKPSYSKAFVNPFDVLQIQPVRNRGWDNGKVLSEKQRDFLRKQNIDPDSMEYAAAKQLISELIERFKNHYCTLGQAKVLRRFGLPTNIPFELASKQIDAIAKNGWRKPSVMPQAAPKSPTTPKPEPEPVPEPAYANDDDNISF